MNLADILLVFAEDYWAREEPIPTDLHYRLADIGVDVPAAHEAFLLSNQSL